MIDRNIFVRRMRERWTDDFGNVSSPAFERTWATLCDTFNNRLDPSPEDRGRWKIVNPATGTGKTQGLCLYAAMLATSDSPSGVLIVVRLKEQADELVDTINRLAGREVAVGFHSGNRKVSLDAVSAVPVLVITHNAYLLLDELSGHGGSQRVTWERLGPRPLIVIDESLSLIEEVQVTYEGVVSLYAMMSPEFQIDHPEITKAVLYVSHWLRSARGLRTVEGDRIIADGDGHAPQCDFTPLRDYIKSKLNLDATPFGNLGDEASHKIRSHLLAVVRGVNLTLYNWRWYEQQKGALTSARLIVPDMDTAAPVVLDATASEDIVYQLFPEADLVTCPQARRYDNVTLHVSRGHRTGNAAMQEEAKATTPALAQALEEILEPDRKVFVVCHQKVEPLVQAQDTHFAEWSTGHWWALDGRNCWRDHDVAVIFGLPWRGPAHATNVFFAMQGSNSDWFADDQDRSWGPYNDVKRALEDGEKIVGVVQAINRTQTRKVIDPEGNCAPTDVFITLHSGNIGEAILAGVLRSMPGIVTKAWAFKEALSKPRGRSKRIEPAIIQYARSMQPGHKVLANHVRHALDIPSRSWERAAGNMRKSDSPLSKSLKDAGVAYLSHGRSAFLIKAAL